MSIEAIRSAFMAAGKGVLRLTGLDQALLGLTRERQPLSILNSFAAFAMADSVRRFDPRPCARARADREFGLRPTPDVDRLSGARLRDQAWSAPDG